MLGPISDAPHNQKTVRITVCGIGGAGGNAVENMLKNNLGDIDYIVMNTDVQSLRVSTCSNKLQIGEKLTHGLGVGGMPEKGKNSALESAESIENAIKDSHIVFIAAGMGGGTGTGAAPVVASVAKKLNILTVAVVTMPFNFEGKKRSKIAESGIKELKNTVDSIIVIPNQNLFRITDSHTTFVESFRMADAVLCNGVKCITDLILKTGLINLDFADIRSIMENGGLSMMTTSAANGENRAIISAEEALQNPLLNTDINNAKNLLISISGDNSLTLVEVDTVVKTIISEVSEDINVIFGAITNESDNGEISVSIIATGLNWEDDFVDINDTSNLDNSIAKLDNSNIFENNKDSAIKNSNIKFETNNYNKIKNDEQGEIKPKQENIDNLNETNSYFKIEDENKESFEFLNEDDFSFTSNLIKKNTTEPDRLYLIDTIKKSTDLEKRLKKKKNFLEIFNSMISPKDHKKQPQVSKHYKYDDNNNDSNIVNINDISKDDELMDQVDLFVNKKNIKY